MAICSDHKGQPVNRKLTKAIPSCKCLSPPEGWKATGHWADQVWSELSEITSHTFPSAASSATCCQYCLPHKHPCDEKHAIILLVYIRSWHLKHQKLIILMFFLITTWDSRYFLQGLRTTTEYNMNLNVGLLISLPATSLTNSYPQLCLFLVIHAHFKIQLHLT